MATGKDAFGIDFEVAGADRAESESEVHGNPKYSSRAKITLADDLTIELVTKHEGKLVSFRLNRRNFGDLKRGDKVVIDEERNVTVNGEKRTTAWRATAATPRVRMIPRNLKPSSASNARSRSAVPHA